MSNAMYIGLETLTMEPCELTKTAYADAQSNWVCTGCGLPKPAVRTVNVHLQEVPGKEPLNFVHGCGLGVVYRPFLDKFPTEVIQRDLYLGRVYGPDEQELSNWATYRGRKRLIIRGTKHAGVRKCDKCGRDLYFATGKRYLYPHPPADAVLFEISGGGGFIVPEDLYVRLDLGKWRNLRIDRLPVVDTPKDDFGELVDN